MTEKEVERKTVDRQLWGWALVLALALLGVLVVWILEPVEDSQNPGVEGPLPEPERMGAQSTLPAPLPGDGLLAEYGRDTRTVEEDLARLGQVLTNFRLLHKSLDVRFLATNADLASALRGETKGTRPMVSAEGPIFDESGKLVDRWGEPIVVHVVSAEAIELRSAGPDHRAWNEDDYVRLANGRIVRGSELH